jgi:hypothetical protein
MGDFGFYGCYKNINEMISAECTPLLDILLKLSSAASNFASAANNVKNVSISDKKEIKQLLDLVFDIRKSSDKIEDLIDEKVDFYIKVVRSGLFEKQLSDRAKESGFNEAVEISKITARGLGGSSQS